MSSVLHSLVFSAVILFQNFLKMSISQNLQLPILHIGGKALTRKNKESVNRPCMPF